MSEPFPDDVRQFLQSHIASVDQLEILRVVGEGPAHEWSTEEILLQAQVSASSVQGELRALEERGILRCRQNGTQLLCQFAPNSAELEGQVRRMLDLYRHRPVTMIRLVYDRPASALRDFADAFRLRKKED